MVMKSIPPPQSQCCAEFLRGDNFIDISSPYLCPVGTSTSTRSKEKVANNILGQTS